MVPPVSTGRRFLLCPPRSTRKFSPKSATGFTEVGEPAGSQA
jgi:hypothetical protein